MQENNHKNIFKNSLFKTTNNASVIVLLDKIYQNRRKKYFMIIRKLWLFKQ